MLRLASHMHVKPHLMASPSLGFNRKRPKTANRRGNHKSHSTHTHTHTQETQPQDGSRTCKVSHVCAYALLELLTNSRFRRRTDWAEEEDEDSSQVTLPAPQITKNKDGTETIVMWHIREDGKKVKTTRRIKKTVVKQVVDPRVAERKHWDKFGQEKGKPAGPQTDTTSVAENIVFRPMAGWKAGAEAERDADKKRESALKNTKIKCRICSGDHWTTKCPFKDTMAPEGEAGAGDLATDSPEPDVGGLGAGGSSYVPPHLRKGGAGAGERMGGKYERDDLATLRVTNVSLCAVCDEAGTDRRPR